VQARAHVEAVRRVRPVREVRIAGRDAGRVQELAGALGAVAAASYESALAGADIVCSCSHSSDPVVRGEWLDPGTHVTSVGFNPAGREVDADAVARALVVVESRAAALAPYPSGSNDLVWAIRDGVIGPDHIHAEIGELRVQLHPFHIEVADLADRALNQAFKLSHRLGPLKLPIAGP
jgi:ornithine cyclodeaminase/alanine dehydrogenase-like protein (mu-crystallin family)